MVKWYTRHADNAAATTTYTPLSLDTRNSTVTSPRMSQGYGHIKYIVASVGVDAAFTNDVGVINTLKLSGDAMTFGDQEIIIGGISSQETGTSVTETHGYKTNFILPTNIWVKQGEVLDMSTGYFGTDIGTPIVSVSIGVERGQPPNPLQYRTRGDSHTAATDAYEALDTKPDGTSGGFDAPIGTSFINRMLFCPVLNANAATLIGANTWTVEYSGDAIGQTAQEINVYSNFFDEGGGTVTATSTNLVQPSITPVEIPIQGGNSFGLAAAFKGTDLGTTFVAATVELVGGRQVR